MIYVVSIFLVILSAVFNGAAGMGIEDNSKPSVVLFLFSLGMMSGFGAVALVAWP